MLKGIYGMRLTHINHGDKGHHPGVGIVKGTTNRLAITTMGFSKNCTSSQHKNSMKVFHCPVMMKSLRKK